MPKDSHTRKNGVTLYTDESHSKMIEIHFYRLYKIMTGSKFVKSRTPNFVAAVSVLLPICCHIGWCMPFVHFLLKKLSRYYVTLLTDGCGTCLWSELEHKKWPGKSRSKNYKRQCVCLSTLGKEGWFIWCDTVS